jgi:hypothetical protein
MILFQETKLLHVICSWMFENNDFKTYYLARVVISINERSL